MQPVLIFTLIFLAISIVLAVFAAKKVFHVANTVFTIIMLALTILSFALSFDARSLQSQVTGEKLFILEKDGTLQAAFVHRNEPTPGLLADVSAERAAWAAGDRKGTLGTRTLLIAATPDTFQYLATITVQGTTFDRRVLLAILENDDPIAAYIAEVRRINDIPIGQQVVAPTVSAEEFKGLVLAAMMNEYLASTTIIKGVNKGELSVYPQSLTFWTVGHLPMGVLKYLINVDQVG